MSEVETLKTWLSKQDDKPILHINGDDHLSSILTVDFGQPLSGVNISNDRGNELSSLMKAAAKSISKRNVRVNFDHHHGVFWASVVV